MPNPLSTYFVIAWRQRVRNWRWSVDPPHPGRTWTPELLPVSSEMVESALRDGLISPEEVLLLTVLPRQDPLLAEPHRKVWLLRLQTEGAPVQ